jgi:HSP20 family protein
VNSLNTKGAIHMRPMWNPVDEMVDMTRRVAQLLGESPASLAPGAFSIPVDLYETNSDLHVLAYLPGVDPDAVTVEVLDNRLTLKADRRRPTPEDGQWLHVETGFGSFVRQIALGSAIDTARVSAEWQAGVLHLTLPKAEAAKPKRIPISVGQGQAALTSGTASN